MDSLFILDCQFFSFAHTYEVAFLDDDALEMNIVEKRVGRVDEIKDGSLFVLEQIVVLIGG